MKRNERERHTTFFNLRDALAEKDCAFCALAAKSAHDFLGAMLYENVNDPGTRKAMAASLGFCAQHADLARRMNDALGIAILYEALCCDLLPRIRAGQTPRIGLCPVCKAVHETEARYISEFCAHVGETDFQQTFFASVGFCLEHFERVTRALPERDLRAIVQSHQVKMFQTLAEQLRIFIEKHDYRKRAASGEEVDAWMRALATFTGRDSGTKRGGDL